MSRIVLHEERCKGCLLCTVVCPKNILRQSAQMNALGYKVAECDPDLAAKCIGCAACAQMCPDLAIEVWRSVKDKEAS